MKKLLLLLLLPVLLLAGCAQDAPEEPRTLLERAGLAVYDAQDMGYTDAADGDYTLGSGLPAYICEDGDFRDDGSRYYPLYQDGALIAMLIDRAEWTAPPQYQGYAGLIEPLSEREGLVGCALLFDAAACWLYDGAGVTKLYDFEEEEVPSRDRIGDETVFPALATAEDTEPQPVEVPTDFDLRWG